MNLKNLLQCAEIVKEAYDKPRIQVENTGIQWDFSMGHLRIGLSGTDDFNDIISDIRFFPNLRGEHRGFSKRAECLLPYIRNIIKSISNGRDIGITLCGHSLSGALVQLLEQRLNKEYRYMASVSFGSPKVWLRWCGPKSSKHTRVFHTQDPIPKLLFLCYAHHQNEELKLGLNSGIELEKHKIENYIKELLL